MFIKRQLLAVGNNSDFSWMSAGKRNQFGIFLYSKIRECKTGRWRGSKHNPGNPPNMLEPLSGDSSHRDSQLQKAGGYRP